MILCRKVSGFVGRIVYTTKHFVGVLTVIGFKKFNLEFGFKIMYLRVNGKKNLVPKYSGFVKNPKKSNTH